MSCNLHLLLHLPQIVRDLGPIWICPCFPFEDLNGKLKKLGRGSKCADLHIHYGVSLFINTYSLSQELLVEGTAPYSFCKRLHSPTKQIKLQCIGEVLAIVHWEKKPSGYTENPVALTGRSIGAFTTLG